MLSLVLLANSDDVVGSVFVVIYLAIIVLAIVGMWKVFEKANQPGWGVFIPIYNLILMLRIAGKPLWWIILMFVPLVSLIPLVLVPIAIAKNFGKGTGFGLGLLFLPFVFYPLLGFGDAEYMPAGFMPARFAQPARMG